MNINRKKSILVVDDVPENLLVLAKMLSNYFDVRLAKSARAALEILKGIRIDLILLDIEMPEMSGFDFLKEIHIKDVKNRNAPVIFITSHASPDVIGRAIHFKPRDYLVKPVTAEMLYKKIGAIIGMPEIKEPPPPPPAQNPRLNEGVETTEEKKEKEAKEIKEAEETEKIEETKETEEIKETEETKEAPTSKED